MRDVCRYRYGKRKSLKKEYLLHEGKDIGRVNGTYLEEDTFRKVEEI